MTTRIDLAFRLGETWPIAFSAADPDGTPIDLTDAVIEWRMASETELVLLAVIGTGISVVDAEAGEGLISIGPGTQGQIAPGLYRHELAVTAQGVTTIQAAGVIDVLPSLKRSFPTMP